jgi:hypothetical protein
MLEKKTLKIFSLFLLLNCYHLSLEKGIALHLNDFEFPYPKNSLCHPSGTGEEVENV